VSVDAGTQRDPDAQSRLTGLNASLTLGKARFVRVFPLPAASQQAGGCRIFRTILAADAAVAHVVLLDAAVG
jgi:hypothetical protein